MNRITELFGRKANNIISVYFTAGFPQLTDTVDIIKQLDAAGADMIEVGMPFSDPLADGPTIQYSSETALKNGMTMKLLFEQLAQIRQHTQIPILLMGYFNPVFNYGVERFCEKAAELGIDGVILPDLPLDEYLEKYRTTFEAHKLSNIFLITPQTTNERIRLIDSISTGFIYMVSSSSTTGAKQSIADNQLTYFNRINQMDIKNPRLIGFGISNRETYRQACQYANGVVIGSAFVKALETEGSLAERVNGFVAQISS